MVLLEHRMSHDVNDQARQPAEDRIAAKTKDAGIDIESYVQQVLEPHATRPTLEELSVELYQQFVASGMTDQEKHFARFYSRGQVVVFSRDNVGLGVARDAEYKVIGVGRDARGRRYADR